MASEDLTPFATKIPTALHVAFVDWMLEVTGFDPATVKTKREAFLRGASMSRFLTPAYQTSDANARFRQARRANQAAQKLAKSADPEEAPDDRPSRRAPGRPVRAAAPVEVAAPARKRRPAPTEEVDAPKVRRVRPATAATTEAVEESPAQQARRAGRVAPRPGRTSNLGTGVVAKSEGGRPKKKVRAGATARGNAKPATVDVDTDW